MHIAINMSLRNSFRWLFFLTIGSGFSGDVCAELGASYQSTPEIVSAWNGGIKVLSLVRFPEDPDKVDAEVQKLAAAERSFARIPKGHVLNISGIAAVRTAEAAIFQDQIFKHDGMGRFFERFRRSLKAAVDPIQPFISYTPDEWLEMRRMLPEIAKAAVFMDLALALLADFQARERDSSTFGPLAVHASLERAYLRAAADLDNGYPVAEPIEVAKRIIARDGLPLEMALPRWVYVGVAQCVNKRTTSALATLAEPLGHMERLLSQTGATRDLNLVAAFVDGTHARVVCLGNKSIELSIAGHAEEASRGIETAKEALARGALIDLSGVPQAREVFESDAYQLEWGEGLVLIGNGSVAEGVSALQHATTSAMKRTERALREATNEYERYKVMRQWSDEAPVRILQSVAFQPGAESQAASWAAVQISKNLRAEVARLELMFLSDRREATDLLRSYRAVRNLFAMSRLLLEAGQGGDLLQAVFPIKRQFDAQIREALRQDSRDLGLAPNSLEIQKVLRKDDVLIDYVIYRPFDVKTLSFESDTRYGAFVIRNAKGSVKAVDLGSARAVDAAVKTYRDLYEKQLWSGLNERSLAEAGIALRQLILDRPMSLSQDATRLYVSPTGSIGLIPLEALPTSIDQSVIRYLVEDREVVLTSSARDMARWRRLRPAGSCTPAAINSCEAYLLGRPAFHRVDAGERGASSIASRAMTGTKAMVLGSQERSKGMVWQEFMDLEATERLVNTIGAGLKNMGAHPHVLTGSSANKLALYELHSPALLVIASHGLFLGRSSGTSVSMQIDISISDDHQRIRTPVGESRKVGDRPDLFGDYLFEQFDADILSMIALAGAADRPKVVPGTRVPLATDDGFLTAYEAQLLQLRATELVVLAACETGLGTASWEISEGTDVAKLGRARGDGVTGFRQAFEIAGAKAVVSSLFEVPEEETTKYVERLVKGWLGDGKSRYAAHRDAQLSGMRQAREIRHNGHPFWWAGFVYQGDPGDAAIH